VGPHEGADRRNLGAGKTTVAKALAAQRNWPYLAIDDCRRRVSDGTPAGEVAAWATFLRELMTSGPAVVEFSGSGIFAPLLSVHARADRAGRCWCCGWTCHRNDAWIASATGVWDIPYPDFGRPFGRGHRRPARPAGPGTGIRDDPLAGPVVRIDGDRSIGQVIEEAMPAWLAALRRLGG
jgi:hypothetical protein